MVKVAGKLWIVIVLSSAFGCKSGSGEMVKAQEDFATKACACGDMACLKGVQAEQEKWVKEKGQMAIGDEDDAKKIEASTKKMTECVMKITKASAGKK